MGSWPHPRAEWGRGTRGTPKCGRSTDARCGSGRRRHGADARGLLSGAPGRRARRRLRAHPGAGPGRRQGTARDRDHRLPRNRRRRNDRRGGHLPPDRGAPRRRGGRPRGGEARLRRDAARPYLARRRRDDCDRPETPQAPHGRGRDAVRRRVHLHPEGGRVAPDGQASGGVREPDVRTVLGATTAQDVRGLRRSARGTRTT